MYGGTKEEMGRLLADAEKISGIKYDVSSYADIVDAIHVVQTEMGITGTTSKEASTTIQGSVSSMKAAWENFLGGMADPKQDFDTLVGNLIDSVVTVADNIVPRIEAMLPRLTGGISNVVSNLITYIPEILQTLLPSFIDGITQVFDGIVEVMPELMTVISDALPAIIEALSTILPQMLEVGLEMITILAQGIVDSLPTLVPALVDIIIKIADTLTDPEMLSNLLDASIAIIIALAEGIIEALPRLLAKAPEIIVNLVTAIIQAVPKLLDAASKIITTLADGIAENFSKIVDKGKEIIDKVKDGIKQKIDDAKNWGKDLIANFISGIKQKWEDLKTTVSNVAQTVKDFLGFSEPKKGPLSNFHTYAPDMMELFARGIKENEGLISKQFDSALSFSGVNVGVSAATMGEANQRSIATQRDVMLNVGITTEIDNSAAMGLARYILPFLRVAEKEAFA